MTRSLCQEVTKNWHSIPSNRTTACSGSNVSVDLGIVSLTLGNSIFPAGYCLAGHIDSFRQIFLGPTVLYSQFQKNFLCLHPVITSFPLYHLAVTNPSNPRFPSRQRDQYQKVTRICRFSASHLPRPPLPFLYKILPIPTHFLNVQKNFPKKHLTS